MDFDTAARLLLKQKWTFAKTMPSSPHWHSVRHNWASQDEFFAVVDYINANSYDEKFYSRTYKMFLLNGYKYWSMPGADGITILINRTHANLASDYDPIAEQYMTLFQDRASKDEEAELFKIIKPAGRILDIGCGAGLFLDYYKPDPANYIGVDPSARMLDFLRQRHPEYSGRLINCRAENFAGYGYDTIVCLFGSAAYIPPAALERIQGYLNPGGTSYIMHLGDNYADPITHQLCGIRPLTYRSDEPGQPFHNYKIVTRTK